MVDNLEFFLKEFDYNKDYVSKVKETGEYLRKILDGKKPFFGITLGSGLGDIGNSIEGKVIIPYEEIPNFRKTTVEGHIGKMIIGDLEGVPIIGLQGRTHYYEVSDNIFNNGILRTVFPVHVLAELGIKNYFVTNAAGGLNEDYSVGDIMIINSHINLIPNPLLGNHYGFKRVDNGEKVYRFQPMNESYDKDLMILLEKASNKYRKNVHHGIYLALTGPTYETEAECLAFRDGLGADAVGMSTTSEVIVARNRGMKVVGFSCITNKISADGRNATNHEEVKKILESSEIKDRLFSIVSNFFSRYKNSSLF